MKEITGNIWDHAEHGWIVITTNQEIKKDGRAVMGKGIAAEAVRRYPEIQGLLGALLKKYGFNNPQVMVWPTQGLITFPTKYYWGEGSPINLIVAMATQLKLNTHLGDKPVYFPQLGCGNGGLDWQRDVYPAVKDILSDDRFIVVKNDLEKQK